MQQAKHGGAFPARNDQGIHFMERGGRPDFPHRGIQGTQHLQMRFEIAL